MIREERRITGERPERLMLCKWGARFETIERRAENVSSTDKQTLLARDKRRGTAALESIGILSGYKGVAVHDGFSSYDWYGQCRHAQCNAHILRELNYVIETSKPVWAAEMKTLLLGIKAEVDKAQQCGRKRLPPCRRKEFLQNSLVG